MDQYTQPPVGGTGPLSTAVLNAADRTLTVRWEDPVAASKVGAALSGIEHLRAMAEQRMPPPPIMVLMGIRLEEVSEGHAVFAVEPGEQHYNPIGVAHGGLAATLLDSAMGCAVHSVLPKGRGYTTLEIKVNYVRALKRETGRVRAIGDVIHIGGRIATAEARIVDGAGRIYAHGTTTCILFGDDTA